MLKKVILGLIAGLVSGLFATGGGLVLVPAFIYFLKLDDKKARGTSTLCILIMVLTSGFFYYKNNYIDWNIGIMCAIGGIVGGFFGAKLLKNLPEKILKLMFLGFLIYAAIRMI